MAEQIADRYKPNQQMAVNSDGSINVAIGGSEISDTNPLPTIGAGTVDTNNSTDTPLSAAGVFTGTSTDVLNYSGITILAHTDQAGTLKIQYSQDGIDWHDGEEYDIPASSDKFFTPPIQARYFRIVYTNGGVDQTSFHLHTTLKAYPIKWSSHNLNDNLRDDDDAELGLSVLKLRTAQDNYVSGAATNNGNFKVSLEEYNGEIATSGLPIKAGDSASIDAFGRWRTSDPETIFDSKQTGVGAQIFWSDAETSGSGTSSTYSEDNARTRLAVSNTTAGTRVRQTKQRFNYQPGKSQLVLVTFNMNGTAANVVKRVGYFDSDNGLFLEADGTTINFVRRTYVTGSAVDNEIAQANWNLDTMDGNGASGVTLDFTKTQILIIDFEWLGVGRARMGFVVDGMIYYAHEFNNANALAEVYMSKPNLPIRYEIINDGNGAAANLDSICCSIQSEGGMAKNGMLRSFSNTGLAVTSSGTRALVGIRLKSTELDTTVLMEGISAMTRTANDPFKWSLRLNPTVAGNFDTLWTDVGTSAVQTAIGTASNTVTDGFLLASGVGKNEAVASFPFTNAYRLGATIAGTADKIVLCCQNFTASATMDGVINWREMT